MTTKQLRHCSAHVNINEGMFCNSYELVSYSTPVALLGMIDGTIVDDNGVEHEHHGMAQDLYLRKVLQVCEYCQRDSEVFCAAVKWEYTDNIGNTYEAGKFTI